jgi:hypothetical protein
MSDNKDLVKREEAYISPLTEIEHTKKMCEALMKAPHYQKMGQDGIYAIVAKAKSLGMDPIEALNGGLYYVQGKVGMAAETMASRMRAAGHSITKDPKSTSTNCILNGKRGDNGDTWQVSFSVDDAKRAGIYNERGPWGKYPQMMTYNRAVSMLYRQLTPDLSKGIGYEIDEVREIARAEIQDEKIQPIQDIIATITQEQVDEINEIFENCEPDYLSKLWLSLRKPPISIETISQLPAYLYDRIKVAALNNQKTPKEQPVSMDELSQMEA